MTVDRIYSNQYFIKIKILIAYYNEQTSIITVMIRFFWKLLEVFELIIKKIKKNSPSESVVRTS